MVRLPSSRASFAIWRSNSASRVSARRVDTASCLFPGSVSGQRGLPQRLRQPLHLGLVSSSLGVLKQLPAPRHQLDLRALPASHHRVQVDLQARAALVDRQHGALQLGARPLQLNARLVQLLLLLLL